MSIPRRPRADDSDEFWSMPPGESVYTHAPEPQSMMTGTISTATHAKPRKARKARRIGFRPPESK